MYANFEPSLIGNLDLALDVVSLRMDAVKAFNLAYSRGKIGQLMTKLLRKINRLQCLTSLPLDAPRPSSHIVAVPLSQIKGSLGRCDDFDLSFNPLTERSRSRWVSILIAMRTNIPLPPVELIQSGDTYYVRDGHHRISVAKALQQESIDACLVN